MPTLSEIIDLVVNELRDIKVELDTLEEQEPIGFDYSGEEKAEWYFEFQKVFDEYRVVSEKVSKLMDRQLAEYFAQPEASELVAPTWNKKEACRLLKERVLNM